MCPLPSCISLHPAFSLGLEFGGCIARKGLTSGPEWLNSPKMLHDTGDQSDPTLRWGTEIFDISMAPSFYILPHSSPLDVSLPESSPGWSTSVPLLCPKHHSTSPLFHFKYLPQKLSANRSVCVCVCVCVCVFSWRLNVGYEQLQEMSYNNLSQGYLGTDLVRGHSLLRITWDIWRQGSSTPCSFSWSLYYSLFPSQYKLV